MLIKWSVFLIISILLSSCLVEGEKARQEKLVKDYFTALNNDDFETALNIVNDSILISEGDFVLAKSKSELLVHFRWDSVFKPRYKVLELATVDKNMEAVIAKTCQRIRFLHDSAIVTKVTIDFKNNKITAIKTFDYKVFDFEKWQSKRDTLVQWIDENHPELSGFVYDQSLIGAKNYLKAIELFITGK